MTALERRYRRWLLAYPADYRRERGDELIGTLLDLAGPERTRPHPLDVLDLLGAALICRVRRRCSHPRLGRTVAAAAFLTAAVATLVGPVVSMSVLLGLTPMDLTAMLGLVVVTAVPVLVRRRWAVVPVTWAMTVAVVLELPRFGGFYLPVVVLSWVSVHCLRREGAVALRRDA